MSNVTVQEALKAAIDWFDNVTDMDYSSHSVKRKLQMALSEIEKYEPVAWQFYQDGKWHNGMDTNNHKQNTIDAGFPVRDIFTSPQPRDWVELSDNFIAETIWENTKLNPNIKDDAETLLYVTNAIKAILSESKQLNTKG